MGHEPGMGSMRSNELRRNIHTGPRQGQGLGPIVSYCASPIPVPPIVSVPCSVNKPKENDFGDKPWTFLLLFHTL